MHVAILSLWLLISVMGYQLGAPISLPAASSLITIAEADSVEVYPSPDRQASLVYFDTTPPGLDRVVLITDGDTTSVFECNACKRVGIEWLSVDLGRVWVPFGNHTYAVIYAEPSSGRISPWFEFGVAVDSDAETVLTFDPDAVTLRALWTGESLASWVPKGVSIYDLRHEYEPTFRLSGRTAMVRYDCGGGEREQETVW